jgi:hypothetical protein
VRPVRSLPSLVAMTVMVAVASAGSPSPAAPELPREWLDTTAAPPSGRTLAVRAGGDLQAALAAAQPGDTITLEAGATFPGPFTLPDKTGDRWITVRTAAPDESFPPPGTRIDPTYARVMPKLEAPAGPALRTAAGAHHYRLVGLEIRPRDGHFVHNLVQLGSEERSLDRLPHHLIVDRCYLHGDPSKGTRRGIALNSRSTAVLDSHLSDFKEVGADSQAIAGWNGPGPFKIVNNYLEGAGENIMFGGADPSIPDLVPSDIEIRRNRVVKPLGWKIGDATYQGTPWAIKNLLELKNARRVVIEGNVFEHNWVHAQNGFAILFTVRTEDGRAPWAVVEDVTFVSNVVRHTGSGVNILGHDEHHPSQQTKRISIVNSLFEDVGGSRWGGDGRLFQLLAGTADVVIEHNTAFQTGSIVTADGEPHVRFVYRYNIAPHNEYGIVGDGTPPGMPTVARYLPGAIVKHNVIVGGPSGSYPPDNFFPGSLDGVRFVDRANRDYRLGASSRYTRVGAGVDFEVLRAAMTTTRRAVDARDQRRR